MLSIKEPCSEDWSKMSPTEKGAFCKACAMEVIDFTDKSASEIKVILKQEFAPNKRTCMRITNFQMNQFNDDFFQWKNDTESFRVVWVFSLIAVFGLSLFSCQNTASKELVSQLQIETTQLLNELDSTSTEISLFEKDTSVSNSITFEGNLFVPGYPWEHEIHYQGIVPLDYGGGFLFDWKSINISLKDCYIELGGFTTEQKDTAKFVEYLAALPNPFDIAYSNPLPKYPVHQPKERKIAPPLEGLLPNGDKKFSAFISPNPIEISSRLYIESTEQIQLKISLYDMQQKQYFQTGECTLEVGKYSFDLKLYDCPPGQYELHLDSIFQLSVLDFMV